MLHAGELLVEPQMAVGEPLVIETEQVQDRGMEVADVHWVLDDVVGEVVGLAVDPSPLRAAAGHPHREAPWVVVAAVVVFGESTLGIDGATKLTSPDYQRVVEEAASLQILDQAIAGLIDVFAAVPEPAHDVGMGVPVVEVDLHEPHAPLHHPPGHEHRVGERAGIGRLIAIERERGGRLVGEVGEFRHAGLHAESHLVLGDPRPRLGITDPVERPLVERLQSIKRGAADGTGHARRIVDVEDRIAGAPEAHAGVFTRQEAARPEPGADRLCLLRLR